MNNIGQAPDALLAVVSGFLLIVAGLCSAAEYAFERMSSAGATDLVEANRRNAALVLKFVEHRRETLAALRVAVISCQTLVTVAITLVVADFSLVWWMVALLSVVISTVAILIFVVNIPMQVGRRRPEVTVLVLAPLVKLVVCVQKVLQPLMQLWRGLRPPPPLTEAETRQEMAEDLRELVDDIGENENLDWQEEDREMLRSVFELGTTLVREVMVPRTDMVAVHRSTSLDTACKLLLDSGLSRVPVTGRDVDDVLGVVYLKDIVARIYRTPAASKLPVQRIMRDTVFIPETKLADDVLRQMQKESFHMALLVDEWGGIAGLVTLEDLLEEVVGELTDEHDRTELEAERVSESVWRVPARLPIDELGDLFDLEIDDEDVDSVGGLFAKALGRIPEIDSVVDVAGLHLAVDRVEGRHGQLRTILASAIKNETKEVNQ